MTTSSCSMTMLPRDGSAGKTSILPSRAIDRRSGACAATESSSRTASNDAGHARESASRDAQMRRRSDDLQARKISATPWVIVFRCKISYRMHLS